MSGHEGGSVPTVSGAGRRDKGRGSGWCGLRAEPVSAEAYLTITRSTGCLDEGQPSDPLAHGESNFLPVGATLHRIEGFEPEERLAHWSDVLEEWRVLAPHPAF